MLPTARGEAAGGRAPLTLSEQSGLLLVLVSGGTGFCALVMSWVPLRGFLRSQLPLVMDAELVRCGTSGELARFALVLEILSQLCCADLPGNEKSAGCCDFA